MKTFRYFYLLAALTAFSACSNDDDEVQGQSSATNADKVLINAVVDGNSLFTRSNPMGANDASQQTFNQGDKLAVGCGDELPVVYTMGADKNWTTEGEDGLAWAESYPEAVAYYAYYPAVASVSFSTFILPADQSSNENITNADYMTGTTEISERPADGVLKLNMNRRMARVIIKIAGVEEGLGSVTSLIVNSQYAAISPVNVEGPVKSITPYAMDNDTYAALVIPGEGSNTETFVEVGTTTGGTRKITGIKPAEAGKSYTYDLYVGERGATLSDPIVEDWTEGTLQGTLTVTAAKRLERTGWRVTGKFEENEGESFMKLIDGDTNTFWRSDWCYRGCDKPYYVVIDLGENANYVFTGVEIMEHREITGPYKCNFYVTDQWEWREPLRDLGGTEGYEGDWHWNTHGGNGTLDTTKWSEGWTKVNNADITLESSADFQKISINNENAKGRYFMIEVTEMEGNPNSWIGFAEIYLWGKDAK